METHICLWQDQPLTYLRHGTKLVVPTVSMRWLGGDWPILSLTTASSLAACSVYTTGASSEACQPGSNHVAGVFGQCTL